MCLLAICYRHVAGAPILVAANRDERFDRPALPPQLQPGPPRVVCPVDARAGGTWIGVNEHGVLVAVTNRAATTVPAAPRSRGLLCRELLDCRTAADAAQRAFRELSRGRYAGANYVCMDARSGLVVYGGDRLIVLDMKPGLHLMTNADLDDGDDERQAIARGLFASKSLSTAGQFLDLGAEVCAADGIVVRSDEAGTVSSDLLALTVDAGQAVYHHAPGPPDRQAYDDYSTVLRGVLEGSRPLSG